jgi:hypothetical protein
MNIKAVCNQTFQKSTLTSTEQAVLARAALDLVLAPGCPIVDKPMASNENPVLGAPHSYFAIWMMSTMAVLNNSLVTDNSIPIHQ